MKNANNKLRETFEAVDEENSGLTPDQQAKNKTHIRQFQKLRTSGMALLMLLETFYLFVFHALLCKILENDERGKVVTMSS